MRLDLFQTSLNGKTGGWAEFMSNYGIPGSLTNLGLLRSLSPPSLSLEEEDIDVGDGTDKTALIIGLSVGLGGGLILIAAVVVVVILFRRRGHGRVRPR